MEILLFRVSPHFLTYQILIKAQDTTSMNSTFKRRQASLILSKKDQKASKRLVGP